MVLFAFIILIAVLSQVLNDDLIVDVEHLWVISRVMIIVDTDHQVLRMTHFHLEAPVSYAVCLDLLVEVLPELDLLWSDR